MSDIENINDENEAPAAVQRVGDRIKNIRETKGYSLKYISQQTKISVRILENIEESHFLDLPNKTYVSGFLKSYCRILNLNADDYLSDFLKEYDASGKEQAPKENTNNTQNEEYQSVSQKQVMAILGVLVIIGAFVAMVKFISGSSKLEERMAETPDDVVLESISASTPLANVDTENIENDKEALESSEAEEPEKAMSDVAENNEQTEVAENTPNTETLEVSETEDEQVTTQEEPVKVAELKKEEIKPIEKEAAPEPAPVKEEEEEEEEEKDKKKEKEEEVEFTDLTLPLYQYDTVDIDDIPLEDLPLTYRQSIINGKQNVFINAVDGDTWITYKADDVKVKKFVLKQGRRLLIRGDLIRLFMGNVKVTKMFLNNRPLIIETKSGVRSIVFPQERASEFKIPLFIYKKDGTVQPSDEFLAEQD